ncbi:MAG TPA: aspartate aminotransferase family protein [Candidatus Acidoferrales bacterium]|nr:aspartate aminotransferase family protein [Candidatus Acidoferrales bacterium]
MVQSELELREAFLRHVCQTSSQPLGIVVDRAEGATIWDTSGRAYLDLLAGMGVANVGHAHPRVVAAIEQQARSYLHVSVYGEMVQGPQVRLAQRLVDVVPGDLSVVYFTNSGAEAIEGAMKTARKFTERSRFIAFEGSFHGDTFGALSLGGNPLYQLPFEPLLPVVERLPFDDEAALEQIDTTVAAVVIELIQGEGGVRIPSDGFLRAVRHRCTEVDALLIVDEVVTGFGRTGKLFACAHWEIVPDILVLAKALGGGMPLGAFIGRPEVMRTLSMDPPLAHVTTFGGHPVSCAAGEAALEVIVSERLPERAARLGAVWLEELRKALGAHARAVRGKGLMVAVEFETPEATRRFTSGCFARGLILNWTLNRDTVVRLVPPLIIEEAELERATAIMAEAVR